MKLTLSNHQYVCELDNEILFSITKHIFTEIKKVIGKAVKDLSLIHIYMVAKLNLIISPKTKVLRKGKLQDIENEAIVLDDVIYLETGNQISSDSIVLDTAVEVDESLLTGEADPVFKEDVYKRQIMD